MAKSGILEKRVFWGQLAYLTRSPARFWDHFLAKNRCLSLLNRPKTVFLGGPGPQNDPFLGPFWDPQNDPFWVILAKTIKNDPIEYWVPI